MRQGLAHSQRSNPPGPASGQSAAAQTKPIAACHYCPAAPAPPQRWPQGGAPSCPRCPGSTCAHRRSARERAACTAYVPRTHMDTTAPTWTTVRAERGRLCAQSVDDCACVASEANRPSSLLRHRALAGIDLMPCGASAEAFCWQ